MTLVMGRYDRNNRSRSNSNRFDKPTMYDAVCDECGKDCKVPFRPSGDKPIYCSDCFERHDGDSSRNSRRGGRDNYRDSGRKEMFHAVCDECGKDCEVPFRPSPDKPIYCSRCFDKVSPRRDNSGPRDSNRSRSTSNSNTDISQLKDQLGSISAKLDKLLKILTPVEEEIKVEEVKEVPIKKVVKKKSTTKKKATKKKKKEK